MSYFDPQHEDTGVEIPTRRTADDGKPIKRKTIDFGTLPAGGTAQVGHGISNLFEVLDLRGTASNGTGGFMSLPNGGADPISLRIDGSDLIMESAGDYSAYSGKVIVEYTTN